MRRAMSIACIVLGMMFVDGTTRVIAQVTPGELQSAAQTATITGTVIQADGSPVAGATVALAGPQAHLTTLSDAHGIFVFTSVPYGTYSIDATAAKVGQATSSGIAVRGDTSVTIQFIAAAAGLKEIAHVSTQTSSAASINVTPASIASVNPTQYAFEGNTSWKELLNNIPGVTVGGGLIQGEAAAIDSPNSPNAPVVLSINGAQPYETAVSLDGMPLYNQTTDVAPGTGVDLSNISMLSFDTADIVRGPGADAPSIVDSVGGSFVLHTPNPAEQNSYQFSMSNDPYGGLIFNAKLAYHLGKLSAILTYNMNNSPGALEGGGPGLHLNFDDIATFSGQYINSTYGCSFNPYRDRNGELFYYGGFTDSNWSSHSGSVALNYQITPTVSASIFYDGSISREDIGNSLTPEGFAPGPSYGGSLAPGYYTVLNSDYADPWEQSARLLEEKLTAYVAGGTLRLAALQNTSWVDFSAQEANSDGAYKLWGTAMVCATNTPTCGSAGNPGTLTNFDGTPGYTTWSPFGLTLDQWMNGRDLLASFARQFGPSSNAGISFVSAYYNEPNMESFTFPGFSESIFQVPSIAARSNEYRLYGGSQISDKLAVEASWYFVNADYHVVNPNGGAGATAYAGVINGNVTFLGTSPSSYADALFSYNAPRLNATWRTNENSVIRFAAGGGYALPELSYLTGSNGAITCSGGSCTQSLDNLGIQPEKSFGWDLGTDIRWHNDTVVSLDLYRTNLYGQFFSSVTPSSAACPTCGGLPLFISEEGNLAQTRMEGINFDMRHDAPRGIYWHWALGLTRGYVVSVPAGFYNTTGGTCGVPTVGANCQNQYVIPGINYDGYFQSTVPYANGTGTIGYRWNPEKYFDLQASYFGNNNAYYVPAFLEFDAHASYPLTKRFSILATFQNITAINGGDLPLQLNYPSLQAPTIPQGGPEGTGLYSQPYGPRTLIVTLYAH